VLNRIMVVADNGHMWRTARAYQVPKPANQRELASGDDARSVHLGWYKAAWPAHMPSGTHLCSLAVVTLLRANIAHCECSACAFWDTGAVECACKHGQQLKLDYQRLELWSFGPHTDGVARS
jgi:hypothetical protein